jgi:hypothetical protein
MRLCRRIELVHRIDVSGASKPVFVEGALGRRCFHFIALPCPFAGLSSDFSPATVGHSSRPSARLNPSHICGLAVSLPKKNPLKNLVSGSSHVLPRGCAKSAVESGVNLGNRGLMRYLPEALEPDPPWHAPAHVTSAPSLHQGGMRKATISAEIWPWRPNWDAHHLVQPLQTLQRRQLP